MRSLPIPSAVDLTTDFPPSSYLLNDKISITATTIILLLTDFSGITFQGMCTADHYVDAIAFLTTEKDQEIASALQSYLDGKGKFCVTEASEDVYVLRRVNMSSSEGGLSNWIRSRCRIHNFMPRSGSNVFYTLSELYAQNVDLLEKLNYQGEKQLSQPDIEAARITYKSLLENSYHSRNSNPKYKLLGYKGLGKVYTACKDEINAIALYNFALAILNDKSKQVSFNGTQKKAQIQDLINLIQQAKTSLLQRITGNTSIVCYSYDTDIGHQRQLTSIRVNAAKQALNTRQVDASDLEKEPDYFIKASQAKFKKMNQSLRDFLKRCIIECQEILEPWRKSPEDDEYAIICFGSLARNEATPYSDIEAAILLTEAADTEENRCYFRVLTKLLNIMIINLNETTPRMQDIHELCELGLAGRYSESPTRAGFCFDGNNAGGRKTPLGNIAYADVPEDCKYELIKTPAQLAMFQSEAWFKKDSHLSTVLMTAALIHGNSALLSAYEEEMETILREPAPVEVPSDVSTRITLSQHRALLHLRESIESYSFRGGRYSETGHFFDAKYHLYRLPNMLLDHIAAFLFLGNKGEKAERFWDAKNLWDKIECIFGQGSPYENKRYGFDLKYMITLVLDLRFGAYIKANRRNNQVIRLIQNQPEENKRELLNVIGLREEAMSCIYEIQIRLQWWAELFIKDRLSDDLYDCCFFVRGNDYTKGWIHNFLLEYEQAIEAYKRHKNLLTDRYGEKDKRVATTLNELGNAYLNIGDYENAKTCFEEAIPIFSESYGEEYTIIARTRLAATQLRMGDFSQAEMLFTRVSNTSAELDYYMGAFSLASGNYRLSENYLERAYHSKQVLGDNFSNGNGISILNNLAAAKLAMRKTSEATALFKLALVKAVDRYGKLHFEVADIQSNLTLCYCDLKQYGPAKSSNKQAIQIFKRIYTVDHEKIAGAWVNRSLLHNCLEESEQAVNCSLNALEIIQNIISDTRKLKAKALNNLARGYAGLGKFQIAIEKYEAALAIEKDFFGENHLEVALALNNLGNALKKSGDLQTAIEKYKAGLSILIEFYPEIITEIRRTRNNLAEAYSNEGCQLVNRTNYSEAETYFKAALRLLRLLYNANHPEVIAAQENLINIYNMLADEFMNKGNFSTSANYYKKMIELYKISGDKSHPTIIITKLKFAEMLFYSHEYSSAETVVLEVETEFQETEAIDEELIGNIENLKILVQFISAGDNLSAIEASWYYSNLAKNCHQQNDHVNTIKYFTVACVKALYINNFDIGDPRHMVASFFNNLAVAYKNIGNHECARELLSRSQLIRERSNSRCTINELDQFYSEHSVFEHIKEVIQLGIEVCSKSLFCKFEHPHIKMLEHLICRIDVKQREVKSKEFSQQESPIPQADNQEIESGYHTKKYSPYFFNKKHLIEITTVITLLNKSSSLFFKGVCDKNYYVDAVAILETEEEYRIASDLQSRFDGNGEFCVSEAGKKLFVLRHVNVNSVEKGGLGDLVLACCNV